MKKELEEKEVSTRQVTSYRHSYILDATKGIYGKGYAAIVEGELVMNIIIWNRGTCISPQDKRKTTIEWLKDLIGVLEDELSKGK